MYALPGGQAVGILEMLHVLDDIRRELRTMNIHLAALSGERITEI